MGDLIRMPYSEVTATLELFDRLGVTPHDFETLRKASSWSQLITAEVLQADPSIWAGLELEGAAVRCGFTLDDFRALATNEDMLARVRDVVRGFSEIRPIQHAIDCDAPVFVPNGWSYHVEDQLPNRVGGIFTWDATRVSLYLSKKQQGDECIVGKELCKELKSQPVFPANVLDYLLANPHLIPEDWKGKGVFFWGTIFRNSLGNSSVRYLYWNDSRWASSLGWLIHDFNFNLPAVMRAR